jgi:hypothetical protein
LGEKGRERFAESIFVPLVEKSKLFVAFDLRNTGEKKALLICEQAAA